MSSIQLVPRHAPTSWADRSAITGPRRAAGSNPTAAKPGSTFMTNTSCGASATAAERVDFLGENRHDSIERAPNLRGQLIGPHDQAGMRVEAIDEGLNRRPVLAGQGIHADFDGCAHMIYLLPTPVLTGSGSTGSQVQSSSRCPASQAYFETTPRFQGSVACRADACKTPAGSAGSSSCGDGLAHFSGRRLHRDPFHRKSRDRRARRGRPK